MLGVIFALLSAVSFSGNTLMSRRGLASATASAGAYVTVLIGVPLFLAASVVTGQIFDATAVSIQGHVLLSLAGVLHFGIGRYCNYRAMSAIGATRVNPIQNFIIPFAVVVAIIFLGEAMNAAMGVGIALIIVGPIIMVERRVAPSGVPEAHQPAAPRGGSGTGPSTTFQLRQAEGYLFATLSVVAYGTTPMLIRAALEDSAGLAVYGGLIATVAAAIAMTATLVVPSRKGLSSAMHPSTMRLFLGAGVFVFLAQVFRFLALALAPVAVISPLTRTSAIFTLVGSWLLNRHLELINRRVVAGIFVSLAGAAILVVARE